MRDYNAFQQELKTFEAAPFYLSDSSESAWEFCKRKFEFRKFYLAPRGKSNYKMAIGHCMHACWQEWIRTKDEEAAVLKLIETYPADLSIYANDENFFNSQDPRSIESCYATLQALINNEKFAGFEIAEIDCLDGVRRPAIEVEFVIDFYNEDGSRYTILGRPVSYIGFMDAILFDMLNKEYQVTDLKTTTWTIKDRSGEFQFKGQALPYSLVLQKMEQHEEEFTSFTVNYVSAYISLLEPKITIYPYKKTINDLNEWFTKLTFTLASINKFANLGWFPRRSGGCMSFNRPCSMADFCVSRDKDSIQRQMMLDLDANPLPEYNPWVRLSMTIPELVV